MLAQLLPDGGRSPSLTILRKLTFEGGVISLSELYPDLGVGDGVAVEDVVLHAAVAAGDVGLVAAHVGVQAVCFFV